MKCEVDHLTVFSSFRSIAAFSPSSSFILTCALCASFSPFESSSWASCNSLRSKSLSADTWYHITEVSEMDREKKRRNIERVEMIDTYEGMARKWKENRWIIESTLMILLLSHLSRLLNCLYFTLGEPYGGEVWMINLMKGYCKVFNDKEHKYSRTGWRFKIR